MWIVDYHKSTGAIGGMGGEKKRTPYLQQVLVSFWCGRGAMMSISRNGHVTGQLLAFWAPRTLSGLVPLRDR